MTESPVVYLRRLPVPEDFRKGLRGLHGSFGFETDDMIELGKVYFELYPDAAQHRDNEQVLAGYEIVRICIFEKLMEDLPPGEKDIWWLMVKKSSEVPQRIHQLLAFRKPEELLKLAEALRKKLKNIQIKIEEIPRGEVRERFMGGVAVFPNTLYLFDLALKKAVGEKQDAQ